MHTPPFLCSFLPGNRTEREGHEGKTNGEKKKKVLNLELGGFIQTVKDVGARFEIVRSGSSLGELILIGSIGSWLERLVVWQPLKPKIGGGSTPGRTGPEHAGGLRLRMPGKRAVLVEIIKLSSVEQVGLDGP